MKLKKKDKYYHVLYQRYHGIKARCYRKTHPAYSRYGGRGIVMCERWLNGEKGKCGFYCFVEDIGEIPRGYSIDRIDNSKGYSPENCRVASPATQSRNTRRNINITLNGKTQCLKDWCKEKGLHYLRTWKRIKAGEKVKDVLV